MSLPTASLRIPEPQVIQLRLQARVADLARPELVHQHHGHAVLRTKTENFFLAREFRYLISSPRKEGALDRGQRRLMTATRGRTWGASWGQQTAERTEAVRHRPLFRRVCNYQTDS